MKQKTYFNELQDEYKYMPLGDGRADVFIFEYLGEETIVNDDNSESVVYAYNQTEFRVNVSEITEDMISDNPLDWKDYDSSIPEISTNERLEAIEAAIMELGEMMYNG